MFTVGIPYKFNHNNQIMKCIINLNSALISKAYIISSINYVNGMDFAVIHTQNLNEGDQL